MILGFAACSDGGVGGNKGSNPHIHTPNIETGLCTVCGTLTYNIGDQGPGEGIIFFRSATGFTVQGKEGTGGFDSYTAHYLEVLFGGNYYYLYEWASASYVSYYIAGTADEIGTGRKNTALILAADADAPAAKACKNWTARTDWFLPSRDELYQKKANQNSDCLKDLFAKHLYSFDNYNFDCDEANDYE